MTPSPWTWCHFSTFSRLNRLSDETCSMLTCCHLVIRSYIDPAHFQQCVEVQVRQQEQLARRDSPSCWRLLVSSGWSVWPPGRHRLSLRPPTGQSETSERKTFRPWLHPHWKKKLLKTPFNKMILFSILKLWLWWLWTNQSRSYSSWTTVGPSLVALSSFTMLTSSKVLPMGLSGFGQQGAR